MDINKKKEFIIKTMYFLILAAILYISIKYALTWFLPFVIGFIIAFGLNPVIKMISNKLKLKRGIVAFFVVLIFHTTIGVLFTLLIMKIFISLKQVFIQLPSTYTNVIEPMILQISTNIEEVIAKLDPALIETIRSLMLSFTESLGSIISSISTGFVGIISSTVSIVPTFFIALIFSIISSFFFAISYVDITSFILRQLSPKAKNMLFDIKEYIVGTLFKFMKAYLIIITITFIELSVGLTILKVSNSISVALIIACVDILPVLGTGGIVIPWVIIEALQGNIVFAIGLLILYVVITIIRNILEPKVVGEQIGLNPLIVLISIFLGVRLFGFIGLFVLPIGITILVNLNKEGKISVFK